jgi:hypothetical protein
MRSAMCLYRKITLILDEADISGTGSEDSVGILQWDHQVSFDLPDILNKRSRETYA